MNVVAGGCSFIFGAELQDQKNGMYSSNTYPALLAKSNNMGYKCVAKSGNANSAISRMVVNECEQLKNQEIFVIVQWTFTCRYEFMFNYDIKGSQWYSMTPWDNHDDMDEITKYVGGNLNILKHHTDHLSYIKSNGLGSFSKAFYKHVGDNEFYETYVTMKEVVFLQQYLKSKNIPYMFTFVDNHIHPENSKFSEPRYNDINIKSLQSQIDWDRVSMFPKGEGYDQVERPRGFYQWAIENKYSVGTTHPLEDAHQDAANLMQEKFNELVKKSI